MQTCLFTRKSGLTGSILAVGITAAVLSLSSDSKSILNWKVHDKNRPLPSVVSPGESSSQERPGQPPSDAIVLFSGKDISQWHSKDDKPTSWKVENGYLEVGAKGGDLYTRQSFGDCQLHVEWATPSPRKGEDQEPGNSGVYLMGLYELQVLDSYQNKTYADGQAAAVYGQFPPLVNASRPPGQWQTYEIIFHGPRFTGEGKLLRPALMTVLHNGVLVQDNVELTGPTDHMRRPPYQAHQEKLPLMLQDHDQPVRFRNVWIRELPSGPV
jgi:3-keto-disaccharide hydrolase